MPHFTTPILRLLTLGVAALTITLGAGRPAAAAEATLIVDADSGKVLAAENATYPWYPASTTKLMTMYLTLKAVKEKRLSMDTLLAVSPNAVAQAPSKMGFKVGTQVTVDNALKMMMVKSANDIAVVLAEGVAGSIEKFADEMNAASRRLGMTQSSWVNPNGLPADEQITSPRDMAILARAILRELPEYEMYWHIPAIRFGKRIMRNTNGLIGRYPDADGMKTGFICASGFNVVATATRGGRKLIVVVFGARSGATRSEKAAHLFEKGFASGGLSWLMPSLGTVDALQPIAAAPPNLRDEMCGPHRKRPAAEEDAEEIASGNSDTDSSSAYAISANSLRDRPIRGPLLGPPAPFVPVSVYIGAPRNGIDAIQVADRPEKKKRKKATATAAVAPAAGAPAADPKADKPATENASAGFSLTPALRALGTSTFAPAAAESKPTPGPDAKKEAEPKPKKKTAKKKTEGKTAAKTGDKSGDKAGDKPADKPK